LRHSLDALYMSASVTIELTREHLLLGTARQLQARFDRGELIRLMTGAYVDRAWWSALKPYRRYRVRVLAFARLAPATVFSHESAAAIWGLPLPTAASLQLHARVPAASGGRSGRLLVRHGLGVDPDAATIDGVRVTSLAVTLADIAGERGLAESVSVLDAGLARADAPTKERVIHASEQLGDPRRRARARRAIEFADPRSESPGESFSRAQIHALGFPKPELQVEIVDRRGLAGVVDFAWPRLGIVGEFDGLVKYGDDREFALDKTAREVLVDEKRREDRIRRVVQGFARWEWAEARDRAVLCRILEDAGLPRVSTRRRSSARSPRQ
jgi:hypothetical protein